MKSPVTISLKSYYNARKVCLSVSPSSTFPAAQSPNLTESAGKEDPATQPPPPQAACGGEGRMQGGGQVPKAQGLKCRKP